MEEEILTEGIKHLKASKAIDFYLKFFFRKMIKLRNKSHKSAKAEAYFEQLQNISEKLMDLKIKYISMEKEYKLTKDKRIKDEYNRLVKENKSLLKRSLDLYNKLNHTYLKGLVKGVILFGTIDLIRSMSKDSFNFDIDSMEEVPKIMDTPMAQGHEKELHIPEFQRWNTSVATEETNYFNY